MVELERRRKGVSFKGLFIFVLVMFSVIMWLYDQMIYHKNFQNLKSRLILTPPQLYTVKYGMEQVACYKRNFKRWFGLISPGTSFACFRITGEVIAGYDLSAVKVELVSDAAHVLEPWKKPKVIIYLPKPQILAFRGIDYELLYARNWHKFPPDERNKFIKQMQQDMKKQALDMGILRQARVSLKRFIEALGDAYGFSVELRELSE